MYVFVCKLRTMASIPSLNGIFLTLVNEWLLFMIAYNTIRLPTADVWLINHYDQNLTDWVLVSITTMGLRPIQTIIWVQIEQHIFLSRLRYAYDCVCMYAKSWATFSIHSLHSFLLNLFINWDIICFSFHDFLYSRVSMCVYINLCLQEI